MEEVVSSVGFGFACDGGRGVLCEEIERDDRSSSSGRCRSDEGVSYDSVSVSVDVVWVTFEGSSSVVVWPSVVSSLGCSSYPERETFALASKNCFQNCAVRWGYA